MKIGIEKSFAGGACGLFLIAAIVYNAVLGFINAHVFAVGPGLVSVTEAVIVLMASVFIAFKIYAFPNIRPQLVFGAITIAMVLFVALANNYINIKSIRDILLIIVFFMIGGLSSEKGVISLFKFLCAILFIFMVIENYMTEFYVYLFEPSSYFASTRGIEEFTVDDSGLFRNALGYTGRFAFNFLSDHRLSSLFLEQVSLANFSMVLAIFVATFWGKLGRFERFAFVTMIILIIVTNSTRTGSGVCLIILAGYFIFPYLPRYSNLLYMPVICILCYLLFYDPTYDLYGADDDIVGRVGRTLYWLETIGPHYFTGGPMEIIKRATDSGYAYVILTQTVIGLLAFWLFTCLIVPQDNAANKRFAHSTSIYIFLNLMIGAAIFSIKVAAPLWFMAGYLYYQQYAKSPEGLLGSTEGLSRRHG